VAWNASSTPATLIAALTGAINKAASHWIAATTYDSAGSLYLQSVLAGSADDYGIAVTVKDTAGQTASFTVDFSSLSGGAPTAASGYPVYNYTVPPGGYAANGNVLAYSDAVMGDWAFQYDSLNRLTVLAPSENVPSQFSWSLGCYAYDAFGNRTLNVSNVSVDNGCSGYPSSEYSVYNGKNQLTAFRTVQSSGTPPDSVSSASFTYDPAGDVTNDGTYSYVYDGEGRLCAVGNPTSTTATAYVYDAEGRRTAKGVPSKATFSNGVLAASACNLATNGFTLSNEYLLDLSGNQVTELNNQVPLTGSQVVAWAHSNVWAGAHLTATYDLDLGTSAAAMHFHLSDPLGTRRVQTTPGLAPTSPPGQIEATFPSLPFGDGLAENPCDPNSGTCLTTADDATEHHFTGQERDVESGNDYFGARYYSRSMGRFLVPDPAGAAAANLSNPQTWNMYSYVLNNPRIFTDPSGTECVWDDGSYDAADDPQTGSAGGCSDLGGGLD
jgi:RHS repeat-associated protein